MSELRDWLIMAVILSSVYIVIYKIMYIRLHASFKRYIVNNINDDDDDDGTIS